MELQLLQKWINHGYIEYNLKQKKINYNEI
jgi:hypothetical protein